MVDHWITNQRKQSGTSSPVQDTESISPTPAKKNLKIQTTVSKDKPRAIGSQKTLSQRYVSFYILWSKLIRYFTKIVQSSELFQHESGEIRMCLACSGFLAALELEDEKKRITVESRFLKPSFFRTS